LAIRLDSLPRRFFCQIVFRPDSELLRPDAAMAKLIEPQVIEPLSRFPAIRTRSVAEFAVELEAIYGASGFDLANPARLDVRGNFLQLSEIALGYGSCGTPITIHFAETDFARLQLPLHGHGVTRNGSEMARVGVNRPSLMSAGRPTVLEYGADFAHLFLRIQSGALQRKLELLLGVPVRREVEFALGEFAGEAALWGLWRLIDLMVQQLDDDSSWLSPLALKELEQAVIVQLLFAGRHNFTSLLARDPADAAPAHVRRAEAYIEANWNRPIMIEDLAAISGVSVRTLFRAFEKTRGCSPMIFAKRVRLERARDLLRKPEVATSVAGIALTCGFSNLGHFAGDYRKLFGERPSETLARSQVAA
jgi:AraC-like DNA-binding protein